MLNLQGMPVALLAFIPSAGEPPTYIAAALAASFLVWYEHVRIGGLLQKLKAQLREEPRARTHMSPFGAKAYENDQLAVLEKWRLRFDGGLSAAYA